MVTESKISTVAAAWRWWWRESNPTDRDRVARATLTFGVAILIIWWYGWAIYRGKRRGPLLPPGPRGWPVVGNLLSLDPNLHHYFAGLAKTYGPIMLIHMGTKPAIVVSSPAVAKEILKDHDATFANRDVPAAARQIAYGGSDIVWTPNGPEWRMLRKVCVSQMLSHSSLDALYDLRRSEVRKTVSYVYSKINTSVSIGEQTFLTVLNVITSMLWGGTIKGELRSKLGAEFRQIVGEVTELLGKPNISDFVPALARFDLQGVEKQMGALFLRFDAIFNSIIDQRLKLDKEEADKQDNKDFLQFLLRLKDEADAKTPLTMIHLKALLMDMVVGGTNTTSNTVEWAIAEMMQKPETMKKAQEELERVVGLDSTVEETHLPDLVYLSYVIKEALRLHPALPLLVPHCPSLPCTVAGFHVPKGARVFVNVWGIQRNPDYWENPLEFDPERFLRASNWDYSGKDFQYFPFGSGRRICAGIHMAERMATYFLASLVHSFDWSLADGVKLDLTEKFGIVMKKATPLVAIPKPRLLDPELYK